MIRLDKNYLVFTIIIFLIEVCIVLFIHDRFIRPYLGDFLVVILIYCFIKSFVHTSVLKTAIAVLLFSYAIETLQYFELVKIMGAENSRMAKIILGNAFEWTDIVVYTLGIMAVIGVERLWSLKPRYD